VKDSQVSARVHFAQFYESDSYLHRTAADFVAQGLHQREPVVMVARPSTYEAVIALTRGEDSIHFIDVQDALAQFMHEGMPDPVRFERGFQQLLASVRRDPDPRMIWIFGETTDELCRMGNVAAALRAEELWNAHFAGPDLSVMCGFSLSSFDNETDVARLRGLCRAHTHVSPPEEFAGADERTRGEIVAVLHHRARVLDQLLHKTTQEDAGRQPRVSMIYVIDDDASVRRSLARLLLSLNLRAQTFESAEAFLAQVDETRDGCLIVDVQLLGMSGPDLQRRMAEAYWTMPVIAMSGAHDPLVEMEAMRMGARGFLRKPFDARTLVDAIDRAVADRS
jgi:CheY-like chemotaxis protein